MGRDRHLTYLVLQVIATLPASRDGLPQKASLHDR